MTNEFFNDAFEGYHIPQKLKNASMLICRTFNIKGICDPAYIVNVIAKETGLGNGQFEFYDSDIDINSIKKVSQRLASSYGCNIDNVAEVESILIKTL